MIVSVNLSSYVQMPKDYVLNNDIFCFYDGILRAARFLHAKYTISLGKITPTWVFKLAGLNDTVSFQTSVDERFYQTIEDYKINRRICIYDNAMGQSEFMGAVQTAALRLGLSFGERINTIERSNQHVIYYRYFFSDTLGQAKPFKPDLNGYIIFDKNGFSLSEELKESLSNHNKYGYASVDECMRAANVPIYYFSDGE